MKSSLKLFFSLFLAAGSFTAFAASYTDGIEYFKAGQPDRAKILLERTLDDAIRLPQSTIRKVLKPILCSLIISSVKVSSH